MGGGGTRIGSRRSPSDRGRRQLAQQFGDVQGTATAVLNAAVRKRGRTTLLTYGFVDSISGTVKIDYGNGIGIKTLNEQIGIRPDTAHNDLFSDHGDSGSVVVDGDNQVIGLLFAGSEDGFAYINQIAHVLSELDVEICIKVKAKEQKEQKDSKEKEKEQKEKEKEKEYKEKTEWKEIFGFKIPQTLITNDPEEVQKFYKKHKRIIYKSISGVRSVVKEFDHADEKKLEKIRWRPVQFQEFVEGEDVRVHVIGEKIIATRILSEATDYRYASREDKEVALEAFEPDEKVKKQCIALIHSLGLAFSGIDLRYTPREEIFCFEVNPSPGYSFYESHTGQQIASTVAGYLSGS